MDSILLLEIIARAGGGGSSGGGGGLGIIVLPLIVFGIIASWWIRRKRIRKAEARQKQALVSDPTWSDEVIERRVTEVFNAFQKDWSELNPEHMKSYLTPRYHHHVSLMLAALQQMGRRNETRSVSLSKVTLFGVDDSKVNEYDRFNVEINASALDNLIDLKTGKLLHGSSSSFEELWHFEREGKEWALDSITQVNRDDLIVKYDPKIDKNYLDFADQNSFFYNADFGWLLMPLRGVLFSEASYGWSDINHHVIGLYHNVVVQFFEYIPLTQKKAKLKDHFRHFYKKRNVLAKYAIAHATLPKQYGNILVERRSFPSFSSFSPSGMMKVSLEWPHFNKMYNVYANDMDKVTSLELLHPAFMEKLADSPYRINIEIIGNDLYLYTTDKKADYQQMLTILKEAFEEMKM